METKFCKTNKQQFDKTVTQSAQSEW